ncbi:MAG: exodeoxyribonuclease VII large subunit, partial [Clostridia bacterium]|nr:exodeoxyribonuclease VII large subunit [Clostridia bacterium]
STGHFYFTIKDEGGMIRAIMFKSQASKLRFIPEDGMKIVAHGRVSAYVRDGQYQIYCDNLEPDGVGALYIAYEQLKRKLEAEGLFDPSLKKPLPKIPARVGIITSATGAAVRDMINVCGRRFPCAKLILYPSLVQGDEAPAQLMEGIRYFNATGSADVIIIGRGGGSIEDLWAFNSEALARCIVQSRIPVISAVGHETDFTICDFVADRRAPTPSAAAELAVPDTEELRRKINNIVTREQNVLMGVIKRHREVLRLCESSRALQNPMNFIDDKRLNLVRLEEKLNGAEESILSEMKHRLYAEVGRLNALNPLAVLERGYSAVYNQGDGSLVKSVSQVKEGDLLTFQTTDGEIDAEAKAVRVRTKEEGARGL